MTYKKERKVVWQNIQLNLNLNQKQIHHTLIPCTDEILEASLDSIDLYYDSVPKAWIRQEKISKPGIAFKTNVLPQTVSVTTILFWGLEYFKGRNYCFLAFCKHT